ncbi:MAG TPA: SIS domain-containing protein [Phycisphaerae bacterium]|nr:SIS domain-containing protein [Phycisphaerae bacterium]
MNEKSSDTQDSQVWFSSLIDDSAGVITQLKNQIPTIQQVAETISDALLSGHKLLTAGNGGSAAEALHLAEELVGRYSRPDRRALPAICLAADATTITCIANDWDFSSVFFRQVEALAAPDDILVVFSTSGNSENLIRACIAMRRLGGKTIGILGRGGGRNLAQCDFSVVVPSSRTAAIQEAQQVVVHLILEHVERVCP